MNHPPQSVYQQVIEKTKGAFFRTQVLRYVSLKKPPLPGRPIFQLLTLSQLGCRKINTRMT